MISYTLDDDTYRTLLKAKIVNNNWDGKIASLQAAWKILFPTGTISVRDNQNMTCTIFITGELSDLIVKLIQNDYIVPRPQGVLYAYEYGETPYFGFDRSDEYVDGFDTGHWA